MGKFSTAAIGAVLSLSWLSPATVFAQEIGTIQKLDFEIDKPKAPDYLVIPLTIKKPRPGQGHLILRQFSERVRVEFDGAGLVKGTYTIGLADACARGSITESRYKSAWRELHRFKSTPTHLATEKSIPGGSLRDLTAKLVFVGKNIALFHMNGQKYDVVDCKAVK